MSHTWDTSVKSAIFNEDMIFLKWMNTINKKDQKNNAEKITFVISAFLILLFLA